MHGEDYNLKGFLVDQCLLMMPQHELTIDQYTETGIFNYTLLQLEFLTHYILLTYVFSKLLRLKVSHIL